MARAANIDVHELLKRDAFDGPASYANHFERNRPAPGGIFGASDQYIILDSFNKLETSRPERGSFTWNFMVQGVTGDQVIGVRDKVDTVVELQFGQFFMPPLPELIYLGVSGGAVQPGGFILSKNNINKSTAALSYGLPASYTGIGSTTYQYTTPFSNCWAYDPLTQTPNGLFTIQIQEAGLQSISDRNGARHHLDYALDLTAGTITNNNKGFNNSPYAAGSVNADGSLQSGVSSASAVVSPTQILASPLGMPGSSWDTYIFTDPLKDVHGVTLQFRGPDIPLSFQPDSYYSMPLITDSGLNLCMLVSPEQLNNGILVVGDRLFLQGCNTGNIGLDNYINQVGGLVATLLPNLKGTSATIGQFGSLGYPIPANDPSTPAAGSVSGTIAVYFDPNINLSGTIVQTMQTNSKYPTLASYNMQFYPFNGSTPQNPNLQSLARWVPPPPYQPFTLQPFTISGSTSITITSSATVNVARLRLRIPVRLRRVVQRLTNYMSIWSCQWKKSWFFAKIICFIFVVSL